MNRDQNLLIQALRDCRSAFIVTFVFSFAVNILNLITPLYSLQVLDRVLGSHNHYTLLMLTVIIVFVYLSYTFIQMARSFTLIKIGEWLDARLSPKLFSHAVASSATQPSMGASQIIREFGTIKTFLTSVGINSLFDAPWAAIYIIVVFMIHPYLGWVTIVGALLMLFMAFLNAYSINSTLSSSGEYNLKSHYLAEIANRNAETVQAMGMMPDVQAHWSKINKQALYLQSIASYRNGIISNITRFFRSILQVAVTGIGAYIVITTGGKDMTAGNMIASSIIVGRALAPFDQAVEVWKQVQSALKSYKKIKDSLDKEAARPEGIGIANPDGKVTAENIFFVPHSAQRDRAVYTLRGVSFALEAGKSLAIIGPSASGKSTLARIIAGVWKPAMGNMHLDGLDVYGWKREEFGKHVGYLSQNIELFNGSVKDNIARMSENPDSEKIIEAAKLAGAHEMISALPKGYETDIGLGGSMLSGGQRQRVGIARAFYGSPKLIVLDEPNANLDDKGEKALVDALANAKRNKITTILISHRPSILAFVDMILVLQDGMVAAFGPRDEIMARASKAMQNTQQQKQ